MCTICIQVASTHMSGHASLGTFVQWTVHTFEIYICHINTITSNITGWKSSNSLPVTECQNFRRKKIAQSPHAGFHPILSQDPKDFWAGTSVEGWTLCWKLDLFVWFLCWLCKIEVLNILPQSLQGSLLLDSCFFKLKMPRHVQIWSIIQSNNLYMQIIPIFGTIFCKST